MNSKLDLTKKEEQLLQLIWEINRPVTSLELMEINGGEQWSKNSIHLLLRSLKDKKIIEECGNIKVSTKRAVLFRAKMSKEEYFSKLFIQKGGKSNRLLNSFASFAKEDKTVDKDELIKSLEVIIESLRDSQK